MNWIAIRTVELQFVLYSIFDVTFFFLARFFFCSFSNSHINNNLENSTSRLSSSSSEEDNSPTQMNNCRKFIDKAPLVKRLSNSLLRCGDEYRPLLNDNSSFSSTSNYLSASTAQIASKLDNITDADANELIASKFGDSCRKSLTSVLLDNRPKKDYCEFDFKQNWMRETSSGRQIALMFSIIISLMYVYKVYIQIAIIKRTKTKKKIQMQLN